MAAHVRTSGGPAALIDTIFALSSGTPPAAIAVVRISGPGATNALGRLTSRLPEPRQASVVTLRHKGEVLDRALVVRFPGPNSATGEDTVELHLHGGRAVVDAVLAALATLPDLRPAQPGEFTRRAFENGRIDLAEAEGLADLLAAETQSQRRAALNMAGGVLSRRVASWTDEVLRLSALVEAELDFSDEADVGAVTGPRVADQCVRLAEAMDAVLARPPLERLRDGVRVVIAGPPNAGKSSLLNALVGREAAIATPVPGTTRDVIEAPVAIAGVPFVLVDTAGLRDAEDAVEQIGVDRAQRAVQAADLVLWLGEPTEAPPGSIQIASKADLGGASEAAELAVSALTGEGVGALETLLVNRALTLLPAEGEVALNQRQRSAVAEALAALREAAAADDSILVAEHLRYARVALDRLTGRAQVEDVLDALFGRFCVGK